MKFGLIYPFELEGAPPLGLASIATYLREYMGFNDTRIIDINFEDPLEAVSRWKPDVVGITAMTGSYGYSIRLAREIKKNWDIPVLLGGVHISALPKSLSDAFDIGVMGEGEKTALEIVQLYENEGCFPKEKLKKIKGLVFHENGRLVMTERRELIANLDEIPIPDRSFINKDYRKPMPTFWGEEAYGITDVIMTSRGCPYRCTFCATSNFWQNLRMHSPKHVVEEIKMLVERYKVDHIGIRDDLFTYNKKRMMEIKELLKEEGILDRITMMALARANMIDDEICDTLVGLNVKTLNFGFESGSDRVLKILKKEGVTVEKIKKAVTTCLKHKIHVSGSFILGSPGETLEDMEKTIDLIRWMTKEGVDRVGTFVMTPYPGTEIWEIAKKRGRVSDDMDWEDEKNQFHDEFNNYEIYKNPPLLDENINQDDFEGIWKRTNAQLGKMRNPQRRLAHLKMRLRHEPIKTIKHAVRNPKKALSFVRKVISSKINRNE
ncbi:MAG: radical SAM protein [Candidatus Altiarchaeota archaeon]